MASYLKAGLSEMHDLLNTGQVATVGQALSDWHPAILGELLEAIGIAKTKRYPGRHGDYDAGLSKAALAAATIERPS